MAADDTFEWYVATIREGATGETRRFINDQRQYLMTLRSEDERQRFVDEVIQTLQTSLSSGKSIFPR